VEDVLIGQVVAFVQVADVQHCFPYFEYFIYLDGIGGIGGVVRAQY